MIRHFGTSISIDCMLGEDPFHSNTRTELEVGKAEQKEGKAFPTFT